MPSLPRLQQPTKVLVAAPWLRSSKRLPIAVVTVQDEVLPICAIYADHGLQHASARLTLVILTVQFLLVAFCRRKVRLLPRPQSFLIPSSLQVRQLRFDFVCSICPDWFITVAVKYVTLLQLLPAAWEQHQSDSVSFCLTVTRARLRSPCPSQGT